jgi:hypothetical protein
MRDQTLLYWGMVVTIFIIIAAMLTARELIDRYFEKRRTDLEKKSRPGPGAA